MKGWTPEQHVEMTKVIDTMILVARTIRQVGFTIPTLRDGNGLEAPNRARPALLWLVNMINVFNEGWLCGTRRYSDPTTIVTGHGCGDAPAEERTVSMFKHFDNSIAAYKAKAIQSLRDIGLEAAANSLGVLPLESMNRDLSLYGKAETDGTVIGPHGSMNDAITSMQIAINYALELGYEGVVPLMAQTNPGSSVLKEVFVALGDMYEKLFRITGMDFGLASADDAATILRDASFGTRLRPDSFFRVPLQSEYLGGRATFPIFSERTCKAGVADAYHAMNAQLNIWKYSNRLPNDETGKLNPLFFRAQEKLGNSWVKLENWSCSVTIFPFEIPAPPTTPPPPPPAEEIFPLTVDGTEYVVTVTKKG